MSIVLNFAIPGFANVFENVSKYLEDLKVSFTEFSPPPSASY